MPQMAPYNWLILFLLFNMILIFTNSYNHYMLIKSKKYTLPMMSNYTFNWNW